MDLLRFILRLPFTPVKGVCRLLGGALSLLGRLLRPLVGNLSWRAPAGGLRCRAVSCGSKAAWINTRKRSV